MIEPIPYAMVFGLLGALLAAAAGFTGASAAGWPGILLALAEGYAALCLFALSIAYALNHLGVSLDAIVHRAGWKQIIDFLAVPYRVTAALACRLARRFDSMAMMHAVAPRLYVGRIPLPHEKAILVASGVNSVVNLCIEFPRLSKLHNDPALTAVYVPMLDGTAPSRHQWDHVVDWIARRHREGHTILVHCAQGRGRSVTVAAAAMCKLGFASGAEEAIARIRAARPKARPSLKQRASLSQFLRTS